MSEAAVMVPELHRDERLGALCPNLRWLCPLERDAGGGLAVSWPLSAAEVAACLREAEEWMESGLSEIEARSRHNLARAETLARREHRGVREACLETASALCAEDAIVNQEILRDAQRFLLFAWAQEERLVEIRRLAARSAHEAKRLQDGLRDDAFEEEAAWQAGPAQFFAVAGDRDEARLMPAWRPVLERLALFLPATAVLCAQDERLIGALHEADLCRNPLERAGLSCPDALLPLRGRLLGERLPMWRILGYTQTQEDRPWLDAERPFLLIMPDGTDDRA